MAGWSKPPTAFVKVMEADLKSKRNRIAAEAMQLVVTSSPVDTGAYRGSHRASVDGEDLGFEPDHADRGGQETVNAGLAVIAGADEPYQAVIVQTNIPYGEQLEHGHSQQAPGGVYGPAFEAIRARHVK